MPGLRAIAGVVQVGAAAQGGPGHSQGKVSEEDLHTHRVCAACMRLSDESVESGMLYIYGACRGDDRGEGDVAECSSRVLQRHEGGAGEAAAVVSSVLYCPHCHTHTREREG